MDDATYDIQKFVQSKNITFQSKVCFGQFQIVN